MSLILNGPGTFIHPVTGRIVGPYEWYEGNAHQEHENLPEPEEKRRGGRGKKDGDGKEV